MRPIRYPAPAAGPASLHTACFIAATDRRDKGTICYPLFGMAYLHVSSVHRALWIFGVMGKNGMLACEVGVDRPLFR